MQCHAKAPQGVPQQDFARLITAACALAHLVSNVDHLSSSNDIAATFAAKTKEFGAAETRFLDAKKTAGPGNWDLPSFLALLDLTLEWADLAYYALCFYYVTQEEHPEHCPDESLWRKAQSIRPHTPIMVTTRKGLDAALLKYERRAAGGAKDQEAERRLIAPLFPHAPILVAGWEEWKEGKQ